MRELNPQRSELGAAQPSPAFPTNLHGARPWSYCPDVLRERRQPAITSSPCTLDRQSDLHRDMQSLPRRRNGLQCRHHCARKHASYRAKSAARHMLSAPRVTRVTVRALARRESTPSDPVATSTRAVSLVSCCEVLIGARSRARRCEGACSGGRPQSSGALPLRTGRLAESLREFRRK